MEGAIWPFVARAQQPALPAVGFLNSASANAFPDRMRAFHQGLRQTDYVEGQNVTIEYRFAGGQNDRVPALVAELVRRQVGVIVANYPPVLRRTCGEHCAGLVQVGGAGIFERSRFHAPYICNSARGGRKSAR